MKIIKAAEPILINQIKVLLFGQPGCRKSSTAITASRPLLLDYDKGAHRAYGRADRLKIESWSDTLELLNNPDELKDYDTIICDTVGKQLDMLGAHLISENGKLATAGGALTLQGYGVRKANFQNFLNRVVLMGKDIILIAHDKEEKIEDTMKVRPEVSGSSYSDIMKEIDLCGYMETVKGNTMLNFNPSERAIGKNCAGFDLMDLTDGKITMAHIIADAKRILNKRNEASADIIAEVEAWKAKIADVKSGDDAMKIVASVATVESDTVKQQIRKLLSDKTVSLGLKYDSVAKTYVPKEETPAA
jgi:hypothetical protein